jgi:putative transposase
MPRTARSIPVNFALHIACRGNNRLNIFRDDNDKQYYYDLLKDFKDQNVVIILHYCIMNTHVHLIVWVDKYTLLAKFMKQVNLSYFAYYKRKYGYCGHLWQGRYKSKIINEDSYLIQCGKYVALNPVRGGIVSLPGEYIFSSYNYYARGTLDSLISADPTYLEISTSSQIRQKHYRELIEDIHR